MIFARGNAALLVVGCVAIVWSGLVWYLASRRPSTPEWGRQMRVVGPIVAVLGVVFAIVGLVGLIWE